MNKLFPLSVLLLACAAAQATDMMMPDGSKDMYVGMALATRTVAAGEERRVLLRPLLQVQRSNGVFVSASGVAGLHLSDTPGLEYGPLLAASNARQPTDSWRLRGSQPVQGKADGGAFFNYYLGSETRVLSNLFYDTSAHGLRGYVGVQKALNLEDPHHSLAVMAGAHWASSPVMRELYSVSAAAGGVRDYRPDGSLNSVSLGLEWNWALSRQWLVHSGVSATRLGHGAADSPVVERRSFMSWSSGLAYRF